MSSRTNKQVQPFTPVPDAEVDLPNFDQWLNPAIEAPVSSQKVPGFIARLAPMPPYCALACVWLPHSPQPRAAQCTWIHPGRTGLRLVGACLKIAALRHIVTFCAVGGH
eukprot:scaffold8673_cov105-Phaeocystis_antarctica.AAC.1